MEPFSRTLLSSGLLALVAAALGALNVTTPAGEITLGTSLAGAWSIAVLLPTLAVSVRRPRDAGQAGRRSSGSSCRSRA